MTVNEVEARTGLDRGTVRYYETEGLIRPERRANGYREYSEADIEKLEKVKLLRALRFSLDDIKAMDDNGEDFAQRLRARIMSLDAAEADIADAKRVIERMLSEKARYETLDARAYLGAMGEKRELAAGTGEETVDTGSVEARGEERTVSPWRRYFARGFDDGLCFLFITVLACDVFGVSYMKLMDMPHFRVWMTVFCIAADLLFEPVLLHFFGTTPGKLIMGIRVTDWQGKRLSWDVALQRTVGVLVVGEGLKIPGLSTVLAIRAFVKADCGEMLFWEDVSWLRQRGRSGVRAAVMAVGWAALIALEVLAVVAPSFLPNLGAVTPAELAENYGRLEEFYDLNDEWALQPDGSWVDTSPKGASGPGMMVLPAADPPETVEYTLKDGYVTALRFIRRGGATDKSALWPLDQAYYDARLLAMSLAGADNGPLGYARVEKAIAVQGVTEFDVTVGPWRAYLKVDTNGQILQRDRLIVGEEEEDVWWTAELVVEKLF